MMKTVFAAPKEINLEDIEESETFITISVLDQEYLDMLTDLTQLPSFERESRDEEGSLQGSDSFDKPTFYSDIDWCKDFYTSSFTINGISAEQLMADCTDEQGANTKTKVYAFATSDDSIILIGLYSNSTNEYNQYLPLFEESLKKIKISNPGDIAKSEIYKK